MLLKYNADTDRFELKGLSINELSAISSALELAGDYGKTHKILSERLNEALCEMEKRVRS